MLGVASCDACSFWSSTAVAKALLHLDGREAAETACLVLSLNIDLDAAIVLSV